MTEAYYYQFRPGSFGAAPFLYADNHLMVHGYSKKERKVVNIIRGNGSMNWGLWAYVHVNYADDYYWVGENGEVEDVIKGSGVKKIKRKIKKWKEGI